MAKRKSAIEQDMASGCNHVNHDWHGYCGHCGRVHYQPGEYSRQVKGNDVASKREQYAARLRKLHKKRLDEIRKHLEGF